MEPGRDWGQWAENASDRKPRTGPGELAWAAQDRPEEALSGGAKKSEGKTQVQLPGPEPEEIPPPE